MVMGDIGTGLQIWEPYQNILRIGGLKVPAARLRRDWSIFPYSRHRQKEITAGHCEASKSYCPSHKIRVSPDENRVFPR